MSDAADQVDQASDRARFAAREFVARFDREMGEESSGVVRDYMLFAYEMGYLRGHGDGMHAAGEMFDELERKVDVTTPSDATKQWKPQDLANQLFDAVSQYEKDPNEVVRLVIAFLKEALVYAIVATSRDEETRKARFKSEGESIALLATAAPSGAATGKP